MNSIRNTIIETQDKMTDLGARVLVDATNFTGRMMNTRAGRFALAVPLAVSLTATRASAEGALRIAMKLVVSQLIVQNTGNIVGAISGLFKSVSLTAYTEAFSGISDSFKTAATASTFDPG